MKKNKKSKKNTEKHLSDKAVGVIWTRVSSKEQAENNFSLETQKKACIEYAKKHYIEIDCILGDTNESAKTAGKGFQNMISYVSKHKNINTIICYSYDRFSRTGPEAMVTKEYLKAKGIKVISATQPIDDDNAAGEFMQNIIFLFSQFENNLRKDKCTAGMITCLENGDWFSQPPMGYTADKNAKKKHTLYINEIGEKLRQAFIWKSTEEISNEEIVKRLKILGVKIDKQKLSNIFHNPFYCGKIRHELLGERIVQGNHPPLISEDIYNKINNLDTHIGYSHAEETPKVPLKRHIKCLACGCYMTGYEVKSKGLWYYKCNTKGCKCNKSAIVMHQKYIELLQQYNIPQYLHPIIEETIRKIIKEKDHNDTNLISQLNARKTKLGKDIENVILRFGLGNIPENVYNLTYATLTKELSEVEIKIAEVKSYSSNLESKVNKALLTACRLDNLWKTSSFDNKQKIQKLVFPEGLHWDKEKDNYRTIQENEILKLMRCISDTYRNRTAQKKDKPCDLSFVVAEAGLEPTTFGL